MANRKRRPAQHVDKDGVRIIEGPGVRRSVWLLALAMVLVGAAVFVVIRPGLSKPPAPPPAAQTIANAPSAHAAAAAAKHAQTRKQLQERVPPTVPAAHLPAAPAAHAAPAAPQVAGTPPADAVDAGAGTEPAEDDTAHAAQVNDANRPTGLALFPPPGTKPIKRGIVVPDDVELPPGYVRHYQTTDDGQQLPPILMFHPDFHPVDEHGNPIPLPEDRIVPPDMAPTGMPIEMLEVPAAGAPVTGGPEGGRKRQDPNGDPADAQTGRGVN